MFSGPGAISEDITALIELIARDKASTSQRRLFVHKIRDDAMLHRSILDQLDVYEQQGHVLYCQRVRRLLPDDEPAQVLAWSDPKHLELQMAHLMRNVSQATTAQDQRKRRGWSPPLPLGGTSPRTRSTAARGASVTQPPPPPSTREAQAGPSPVPGSISSSASQTASVTPRADSQSSAVSSAQKARSGRIPAAQTSTPLAGGRTQSGRVPRSQIPEDTVLIDLVADDKATPEQMHSFLHKVQHNTAFQRQVLDRDEAYRSARTSTSYAKAAQLRSAIIIFTELDERTFFPHDDRLAAVARESTMLVVENEARLMSNVPLLDPNRDSDYFRRRYPAISQLRSMSQWRDDPLRSTSNASTSQNTCTSQPSSSSERAARADPPSQTTTSSALSNLTRRGVPAAPAPVSSLASGASSSSARQDDDTVSASRSRARSSREVHGSDKIWRGMFDRK